MTHPAVEGRELLDDPRYVGYREALEDERKAYVSRMTRFGCDPRVMDRCAGAIEALDYCLGKPQEMKDTSPVSTPPGDPA